MVLDLELHVEFRDHGVVESGTIICDDSLGDSIPADKVMLNELLTTFLVTEAKEAASTHFVK